MQCIQKTILKCLLMCVYFWRVLTECLPFHSTSKPGAGVSSEENTELLRLLGAGLACGSSDKVSSILSSEESASSTITQNKAMSLPLHPAAWSEFRLLRDEITHRGILQSFDSVINSGRLPEENSKLLRIGETAMGVSYRGSRPDILLPSAAELQGVVALAEDCITENMKLFGTDLRTPFIEAQISAANCLSKLINARQGGGAFASRSSDEFTSEEDSLGRAYTTNNFLLWRSGSCHESYLRL